MLDIDLLKTFLEVNKTRHFGQAGDSLFITPAAVSARIKQLEGILGVELFVRNRKNIQLTPEGERLIPHAETMLWARARQEVALPVEQSKQIAIGATYGLWNFALQERLAQINSAIPQLALRAEAHPHELLIKMLLEKNLDLALIYEPPALVDFVAKKVGQLKLVLATTLPGTIGKKAVDQGYVYVDWGTSFAIFHGKRFAEGLTAVMHTNMSNIAADFICERPGSAYLPKTVVERLADQGVRQVKDSAGFSRPIYALYRSGLQETDWFAEVLRLLDGLNV